MTNVIVPRLLLFDLTYVIPSCLLVLTLWTLYSTIEAGYDFPPGGLAFGWFLSIVSCMPIVCALCRHLQGGCGGVRAFSDAICRLGRQCRCGMTRQRPAGERAASGGGTKASAIARLPKEVMHITSSAPVDGANRAGNGSEPASVAKDAKQGSTADEARTCGEARVSVLRPDAEIEAVI